MENYRKIVKTGEFYADQTQEFEESEDNKLEDAAKTEMMISATKELLENSKILTQKLEEEAAGMRKLKEEYYTLRFKLSDLQMGRAAIARLICDTKILLERI